MWEINRFVRVTEDSKEAYPQGRGYTLAAAIRDAGVRCETCEHWDGGDWDCSAEDGGDTRPPDFFCAHWSGFAEGSK